MGILDKCQISLQRGMMPIGRNGCTNQYTGNRFLFIYLLTDDRFFDLASGRTGIVDDVTIHSNNYFYCFYRIEDGQKKYIHIEKDNSVLFKDKPTFFVESDFVDDLQSDTFLNLILQPYLTEYNCRPYNVENELVKATQIKEWWEDFDYLDEDEEEDEEDDNESTSNITQSSGSTTKQGCYIATCVYGSYDCQEVWVLRRYRDYKLNETWYGRLFIKIYYAISPTIVKLFGNTKWFKKVWKSKLDKKVKNLKNSGYEDSPYDDLY